MTHPPTPPADETHSAGTEPEHRNPIHDGESDTIQVAEQSTAPGHSSTPADAIHDDAIAEDTAVLATDTDTTATATATDATATDTTDTDTAPPRPKRRRHAVAYLVLPMLLMAMAVGAGYLKYRDGSARDAQTAAVSSVQAATEGTIALLSYAPDTAQTTLTAARDRLTGAFRDSYTSLTNDVVIPGAQQKKISATATVPAASSVSASARHAIVLVYVDQSVIVGNDAPSATDSVVQVTLDKTGDRWLISEFDPK